MINGFSEGLNIGSELQKVIETAAATIPEQVSATWLNVSKFSKVEPMVLESRLICRSVYHFLSG